MKVTIDDDNVSLTIELKGEAINWPNAHELLEKFRYAMLGLGYPWDIEEGQPPSPRDIK